MPNTIAPSHAVMEGKGAYNKHAKLPAAGGVVALPLLEKAVQSVELDSEQLPIVIADYGSSEGKNSLVPMQLAIRGMRRRVGRDRAISVIHIDQRSADRFIRACCRPAPSILDGHHMLQCGLAVPQRSLPTTSFPLRAPARCEPNSIGRPRMTGKRFCLSAQRSYTGGRLVVVLPGLADDGSSGFEHIMNEANAVLNEMAADGAITAKERSRMVVTAYPRRKRDLLDPFRTEGTLHQLTVEDCHMSELPDAGWADFERDGNKEALLNKHVLFFRSIFVPSLASALDRVQAGHAEALGTFGDQMEQHLRRRLAIRLVPTHSFVQTIVFAKVASQEYPRTWLVDR